MSDDDTPQDDTPQDDTPQDETPQDETPQDDQKRESRGTETITPHFFDDGLEEPRPMAPISLHGAAGRNIDSVNDDEEASPVAFPIPMELGTFHGTNCHSP